MTLVSSGDISLIAAFQPTRSICWELYTNYTGPRNLTTMSLEADFSAPHSITEFYGYTACEETVPSAPTGITATWLIQGVISVAFTRPGDADGVDIQYSTDNATWDYFLVEHYTGSSPYATSTSCDNEYFRVRGYNCAGDGSWSSGDWAGPCPP